MGSLKAKSPTRNIECWIKILLYHCYITNHIDPFWTLRVKHETPWNTTHLTEDKLLSDFASLKTELVNLKQVWIPKCPWDRTTLRHNFYLHVEQCRCEEETQGKTAKLRKSTCFFRKKYEIPQWQHHELRQVDFFSERSYQRIQDLTVLPSGRTRRSEEPTGEEKEVVPRFSRGGRWMSNANECDENDSEVKNNKYLVWKWTGHILIFFILFHDTWYIDTSKNLIVDVDVRG